MARFAAGDLGDRGAERQLLEAIERYGGAMAARVALETSLTVFEADQRRETPAVEVF